MAGKYYFVVKTETFHLLIVGNQTSLLETRLGRSSAVGGSCVSVRNPVEVHLMEATTVVLVVRPEIT